MGRSVAEWPLVKNATCPGVTTRPHRDVACMFVAMSAFRARCQAFNDWSVSAESMRDQWILFTSVFYRAMERAFFMAPTGTTVHWEQVPSEAGDIVGYYFWISFTGKKREKKESGFSGGVDDTGDDGKDTDDDDDEDDDDGDVHFDTLDGVFTEILMHYARMRLQTQDSKRGMRVIATKELARIDKGELQPHEFWKGCTSDRAWNAAVSLVTGTDHSSGPFDATTDAFSPKRAFEAAKRAGAAEPFWSRDGNLGRGLRARVQNNADGTRSIFWPERPRVYEIPSDIVMCATNLLPIHLLPHHQIAHMLTRNQQTILLPQIVASYDENADKDREQRHGANPRLLEHMRAFEDMRGRFRTRHAQGGSYEANERIQNATPYHGIARVAGKMLAGVIKIPDAVVKRKMYRMVSDSALRSFEAITSSEPTLSPIMKTIMETIEREDLLRLDKYRAWFRRPLNPDGTVDTSLSVFGSYQRKVLANFEHVSHFNHLHESALTVEWYSLDAYRFARGLHSNFAGITEKGATGKSFVWKTLVGLRINGTVITLMYFTDAAMTATESEDSVNMSDAIYILDEAPKAMIIPNAKDDNKQCERLKMVITENEGSVQGFMFDDNGRRVALTTRVLIMAVFFLSFNASAGALEHAVKRRFGIGNMPEAPPESRDTADTMNQALLDPLEMDTVSRLFKGVHHFKQAVICLMEKLIHAKVLCKVSTDICGTLNMALAQAVRRMGGFVGLDTSPLERLSTTARVMAMTRVFMDAFLVHDDGLVRVTEEALRDRLEARLFVTVEDYVSAVGLCSHELQDPVQHAIRVVLRDVFANRTRQVRPEEFESLFYMEKHEAVAEEGIRKKRDWSYAQFDMRRLVKEVKTMLPDAMNGFQVSDSNVRDCLRSYTDVSISSHPYEYSNRALPGHPAEHTVDVDLTKEKKRFMAARIEDKHVYLVHLGFLAPQEAGIDAPPSGHIVDTLQHILSVDTNLPRDIFCGVQPTNAARERIMHVRPTRPGPFSAKRATVTRARDFALMPELEENIPNARERLSAEEVVIDVDLDTYALRAHNARIFLTEEPIDMDFTEITADPVVAAAESGGIPPVDSEDDVDAANIMRELNDIIQEWRSSPNNGHFSGVPVTSLSPDKYSAYVTERLPQIKSAMGRVDPAKPDLDYEPDMVPKAAALPAEADTCEPDEMVDMAMVVRHHFPSPKFFGYDSWDEYNHKLTRYHPSIVNLMHTLRGK